MKKLALLALLSGFLSNCSQLSSRERMERTQSQSRAHSATSASDIFFLDYRSPEDREVDNQEFFFKHCELVSRKRFPSRADYECSDLR